MTETTQEGRIRSDLVTRIRDVAEWHGPIEDDTELADVGLDSLALVDLRDALERDGTAVLTFSDFFTHHTVGALTRRILSLREGDR
ncbi:acyl carrier protein [Curtobacterium poinsettiae]|uniref:acyl carrier protein n=1 Tax=Curtobacterium poinsettiae TaxID=159612 RepID=UPI00236110A3|nr:acyl carrier protein [Curtobacterium flaccumfaciens]MDD1385998.1 acyl carrier protein [Curtobacterium flaccumfaciens pv. poinsettiae]